MKQRQETRDQETRDQREMRDQRRRREITNTLTDKKRWPKIETEIETDTKEIKEGRNKDKRQ